MIGAHDLLSEGKIGTIYKLETKVVLQNKF